jgi:hypothetical protein
MRGSVAIIIVTMLTGCAHQPPAEPQIQVVERRIEVPKSLLSCDPEPRTTAAWKTQKAVASYMIRLAEAGADCRGKVAAISKIVSSR